MSKAGSSNYGADTLALPSYKGGTLFIRPAVPAVNRQYSDALTTATALTFNTTTNFFLLSARTYPIYGKYLSEHTTTPCTAANADFWIEAGQTEPLTVPQLDYSSAPTGVEKCTGISLLADGGTAGYRLFEYCSL